jgi:hypothetical protein
MDNLAHPEGQITRASRTRLPSALYRLPLANILYPLLLVLIIAISGWWRAANLDAFGISNDEGTHLMWAKLADLGYPLYSQTRAVQGPWFIGLIQLSFRFLGTHVASGRWMEISLGLVTLLGAGLLARQFRGWLAGLTAAVVLSIAPLFFQFSRIVRGDVAASAFLILSVSSGVAFRERGRRAWLILSGLLLAGNLLVKAISPLAFILILQIILQRRLGARPGSPGVRLKSPGSEHQEGGLGKKPGDLSRTLDLLGDVLSFTIALALPFVLCFVTYDPAGLFDALVTFRLDLRAASSWNLGTNLAELGSFLGGNAALALLAMYGWLSLLLTVAHRSRADVAGAGTKSNRSWANRWQTRNAAIMGLWLGVTLFTLLGHTPLFAHHLISLLPPLAVLAGVAVQDVVQSLIRRGAAGIVARPWPLIGLVLIGFYVASLPPWLNANRHNLSQVTGGRETEAIETLRAVTAPGDFVISDNQMLTFMADRLSPPPLGDIALVAIQSGRQTAERLISLSMDYQVEAVVTWSHRLPWLPAYLEWVEKNYLVRRVWDDQHIMYFGRRMPEEQIPNRINTQVGDTIELLGYKVENRETNADSRQGSSGANRPLDVTVYWRTAAPVEEDYTVFVQVLSSDERIVAQADSQPLHGYLPTSEWATGEIIPDRHNLSLPDDLRPGQYRVITGMYLLDTLQRLPVQAKGSATVDDRITLTWLQFE